MRKIVLLHKRQPSSGVEEFHAKLAATSADEPSIAELLRYVQSHTLVQGYRKGELLFDALEEFSFPSEKTAAEFVASPVFAAIKARRHALVDAASSTMLAVDVRRVKDRPVLAGSVKNIEFVTRRESVPLEDFRRYWLDVHGPLGARIPTILRYEQNHTAISSYANGAQPSFDGLAITWFASTDAMREGTRSEVYDTVRADEANFLPDGHLPIIITREVLER